MSQVIANALAALASGAANTGSKACILLWLDEPRSPKSLIK